MNKPITPTQSSASGVQLTSILDYPERGPYGKSSYRGNCSGYLIRDLLSWFRAQGQANFVVDPSEGSGTTGDVCRELGIPYRGFDLHSGFNILRDRLRDRLPTRPDFAFFHSPYGDMIQYSGSQWGQAHKDDLSRCADEEEFIMKLEKSIVNIYDALANKGHYAVLIGDQRKNGQYYSFQSDVIQMGIGKLRNVMVKVQHNTQSALKSYRGRNFIPIMHEYLMVFMKDRIICGLAGLSIDRQLAQMARRRRTWKMIVGDVLEELGGRAHLSDIYEKVKLQAANSQNKHIDAKVRQTLQRYFTRVGSGTYTAEPMAA